MKPLHQLHTFSALVAGLFAANAGWAQAAAPAPRPNVLLILADDLGFSDLGSYGGEIRTPNLDRLAAEGRRHTQFYNNAVCNVSRASLMTGLYPRQGRGAENLLRPNMVTIGTVMQAAGYGTTLIGKWHLGATAPRRPIDRGFENFYGVLDGACNYFDPALPDPAFYGGKNRPFARNEVPITDFPRDYYTTDAFSDETVRTIRHHAETRQPFFISLNYTAPHFPLQAWPEDIARYRGKYRDGYDVLRERRYQRQKQLGLLDRRATRLSPRDGKTGPYRYDYEITPWARLEPAERQREEERMEVYAAMVDRLDQGVGRILAALDDTHLADNTIVIFLSDNGGCASVPLPEEMRGSLDYNAGIPVGDPRGYEVVGPGWGWAQNAPFRRHKTWTYEGGCCTPMIVRWPGVVAANSISATPGHLVDFMPTLLEVAGARYPEKTGELAVPPLEGQSLVAAWRGAPNQPRRLPLFWELYGNRAVRDGPWKLVWSASVQRWELYNLAVDRAETTDVAAQEKQRVLAMAASWTAWKRQVSDAPGAP